jgi:hypothetical protein
MLTTLARTSPSTGLLIVEVWRDGPEYAQRASSFGEATAVIRVCDLPAAAADAFLAQVCGDFGADHLPFSALLWQRTAGNPFHLHTCIDHLIAERAILPPAEDCAFWRVDLGRATSLDATADAAALAALRLNGLSPPCKHALAMAARLGSSFSEPPLARALGVSPQETAVCLAQAMAAGVVAPPPGGQSAEQGGVWRFVHDRLHEAALGLVDEAAGRAMHALVGRQMWAALCADSPAVDIMQAMYQRNLGAAEVDSATESAELQAGHLRALAHSPRPFPLPMPDSPVIPPMILRRLKGFCLRPLAPLAPQHLSESQLWSRQLSPAILPRRCCQRLCRFGPTPA